MPETRTGPATAGQDSAGAAVETAATRKGSTAIRVYCTPAEHEALTRAATRTGMSVSMYLRRVGLGYQPRSMIELDRVEAMLKVSADAGRLGGLLKLWLTDDAKLARFKGRDLRPVIVAALAEVAAAQAKIREIAATVLKTRP